MKNKWLVEKPRFKVGQAVKVERLEEEIPAKVLMIGDANLYLLFPSDGPPMFWAFESYMTPLSPEEKQSLNFSPPSSSKKLILTHF
jgi:hypothetical protein